jgi:hypothetical protein
MLFHHTARGQADTGLERVAKANGFSLHAGVSCEGHQKDNRNGTIQVAFTPLISSLGWQLWCLTPESI